jgi:hypothetical protein
MRPDRVSAWPKSFPLRIDLNQGEIRSISHTIYCCAHVRFANITRFQATVWPGSGRMWKRLSLACVCLLVLGEPEVKCRFSSIWSVAGTLSRALGLD